MWGLDDTTGQFFVSLAAQFVEQKQFESDVASYKTSFLPLGVLGQFFSTGS